MSEVTRYAPEKNALDWRKLADVIFPADALQPAPRALVVAGAGFKSA
jgi:hypothetical protein